MGAPRDALLTIASLLCMKMFKYKCVSNLQVKPGYTRKSPGIPEKYPSARPHAAHAYSQGHCANCGAHRLLKYAHRTMCARYKCQKAASAQRQARLAGGGADDAVVPTFCYKIEAVLGMRFCDPDQLIGKKRRNRLAAARALRIRQPVVLVAWLDR